MDAQSRVEETATLVALVQSIARLELEEGYGSEHASSLEEMLAENRFLAARDGVEARLIDPATETLRPIPELLDELLDAAQPHASALGCLDEFEHAATLVANPGAARQRAYSPSEEGLVRLVAHLGDLFTA